MKVIDKRHIYECDQLGGGTQTLTFVKRSSGASTYEKEWVGMQTQEVLRALIDRTKFLQEILPCEETPVALYHLHMALYWYEVRAYRRKQENVNRLEHAHTHVMSSCIYGDYPKGIPFPEKEIESHEVGADGHIII